MEERESVTNTPESGNDPDDLLEDQTTQSISSGDIELPGSPFQETRLSGRKNNQRGRTHSCKGLTTAIYVKEFIDYKRSKDIKEDHLTKYFAGIEEMK